MVRIAAALAFTISLASSTAHAESDADDVVITVEPLSSNNKFDGRFLRADDLMKEPVTVRASSRRMHTTGMYGLIIDGLEVVRLPAGDDLTAPFVIDGPIENTTLRIAGDEAFVELSRPRARIHVLFDDGTTTTVDTIKLHVVFAR